MPTAGIATCPQIETLKYTYILVTQGDCKFNSLTIPSENLAETCFVKKRGAVVDIFSRRKIDQAPMAHVGAPINAERARKEAATVGGGTAAKDGVDAKAGAEALKKDCYHQTSRASPGGQNGTQRRISNNLWCAETLGGKFRARFLAGQKCQQFLSFHR